MISLLSFVVALAVQALLDLFGDSRSRLSDRPDRRAVFAGLLGKDVMGQRHPDGSARLHTGSCDHSAARSGARIRAVQLRKRGIVHGRRSGRRHPAVAVIWKVSMASYNLGD